MFDYHSKENACQHWKVLDHKADIPILRSVLRQGLAKSNLVIMQHRLRTLALVPE